MARPEAGRGGTGTAVPIAPGALDPATILAALEAGTARAAIPDPGAPDGWRVVPEVRAAILARFRDRAAAEWQVGPLRFRDRASLPLHLLADPDVRIVPGGTSVRAGARIEPGVVIMPPSFVNVGAWIGAGTMVDSLVLVGSCAQVGARVHLSAGVVLGGVLEPAGARPVIVEDDVFVGAGALVLEGVLVRQGAVIGAGVVLTGTSRLYDLDMETMIEGTPGHPLVVPPYAVVVPGTRPAGGAFASAHRLSVETAIVVKRRDARTDGRTALEDALR